MDKISFEFNFANAYFENFREDLISGISTFERFRVVLFLQRIALEKHFIDVLYYRKE